MYSKLLKKNWKISAVTLGTIGGILINNSANQSGDILHYGSFDWPNNRWYQSFDYKR